MLIGMMLDVLKVKEGEAVLHFPPLKSANFSDAPHHCANPQPRAAGTGNGR